VPKAISGTSGQHDNDSIRLASYDFLLAFCSDLRYRWKRCQVISRWSQQNHNLHPEQERLEVSKSCFRYAAAWVLHQEWSLLSTISLFIIQLFDSNRTGPYTDITKV